MILRRLQTRRLGVCTVSPASSACAHTFLFRLLADKDDLKTGAGAEYVDASSVVLIFCTEKYFQSRACAREILRAVLRGKPLIAVLEPDASRGGLDREAIRNLLIRERFPPHNQPGAPCDQPWAAKWALDGEVTSWGYSAVPSGDAIFAALFADDPIEWNRFTAFQVISLRLISERLLAEKERGAVYVQGEVGSQALAPPPLTRGRTFHLYCSPHNSGAKEIGAELGELLGRHNGRDGRRAFRSSKAATDAAPKQQLLKVGSSLDELDQCEYMLLYLTANTWTHGDSSIAFARELGRAQRLGVRLLLVHEFPCCLDALVPGGVSRGACDFNELWNEGWTPKRLLTGEANVYNQIAMALKPGPFRAAGLAVVIGKMAEGGGKRMPIELSAEAEEESLAEYEPAKLATPVTFKEDEGSTLATAATPETAKAAAENSVNVRKAPRVSSPPGGNRAFQKRVTTVRRSQQRSAFAPPQSGEFAASHHVSAAASSRASAAAATAAVATLRRSCTAHDARCASLSASERRGQESTPSVGTSLPAPGSLPQPSRHAILPASAQLAPALLESDDESEAVDKVFEPAEEPAESAEAGTVEPAAAEGTVQPAAAEGTVVYMPLARARAVGGGAASSRTSRNNRTSGDRVLLGDKITSSRSSRVSI